MNWDDACIATRRCSEALAVVLEPTRGREIKPTTRASLTCKRKVRDRWLRYECNGKCPRGREL